jgi:hypothetical protein
MNNRFYVYALIDPRTLLPFYIGKGTAKRDVAHINEAKKDTSLWSNSMKCRRIRSIQDSGLAVIIERWHKNLQEEEAYDIESQYISQYGRLVNKSGILTNIISEDSIHPRLYKKVDQYAIDGRLVQTFDSVQEAAAAVNVTPNTLSGVLNQRSWKGKTMRTAGGFRWVHAGSELPPYDRYEAIYESKKKRVCQYSLTGEFIQSFNSAVEASDQLGVNVQRISICCNRGRLKTADGFCWAFEGEEPRLPNLKLARYQSHHE